MTFLDFFAGIGGFRRGLELTGHKCLGFCEFDKFAVASYVSMHCITDEQREYLTTLNLKQRQKEILKDEYRNGEWYANDIKSVDAQSLPRADCWCFGFPCQDISIAGKRAGFKGNRSSLFFTVTKLIRNLEEKDRPNTLLIENVKNLLSVNRGFDFARLLIELDEIGYDAEWQVLNSKDFEVPQNRERVFIVGHLRGGGGSKVFPLEESGGEDCVSIVGHRDGYRKNTQVFSSDGIAGALGAVSGGGNGPHVAQFCDLDYEGELTTTDNARALKARYYKGASKHKAQDSGVAVPIGGTRCGMSDQFYEGRRNITDGVARPVTTVGDNGVVLKVNDGDFDVYATWSEEYQCYIAIRRLTPRECFRLQGWSDDYFDKAQFVNSDSQLYKQAGNGVTVNVIQAIGERMG